MNKSWLVLPVMLLLLVTADDTSAQQEVLDSLINIALENNPEIKSAEYLHQSTDYKMRASGSLPDPTFTIGVLNLPVNSFSLDETPMSGINLGLSQKIPWPGKLSSQKNLADVNSRVAETQVDIYKNQLVRQVTDTYLDFSYWTLSLPIIEEFLDLLEATRKVAEVRYANGEAPAQDMLRISSMSSRTEVRLLNARQKRHTSLINLRQITGDYSLSDELTPYFPEPGSVNSDFYTIQDNPLLKKAVLGIKKSEVNRKLFRSEYWPDFILGVDYRIRNEVSGDPVRGADFLSFKVGFTLPLWFSKKQNNKTESAKWMTLASREQERSARDLLTSRLNEMQSRSDVERESLKEYDLSILPEARAAVEAAEVAYEVGQVDFNALLAAHADLFEIKLERLNLLKQYHQSLAVLAELSGTSFERR